MPKAATERCTLLKKWIQNKKDFKIIDNQYIFCTVCNKRNFQPKMRIFLPMIYIYYTILTKEVLKSEAMSSPVITLSNGGQIQGRELRSYKNNRYYAFQEIPYAAPPVGDLRFKAPVEATLWNGVLKTTKNTKICVQLTNSDPKETEDCLNLNVYTPAINLNESLPVYVFFHYGVFTDTNASFELFGPQLLMDHGIILVTPEFRLGVFGFLSTGDEVIPGNLGLKDQTFVLQWVQKNIEYFGGDKSKVTIGGQSSGGGSVGYHILSKHSAGLFRGVIQQSGSPVCSKMFIRNPKYFAFALGHLLDNKVNNQSTSEELLDVLRNASVEDIKKYSNLPIPESMRNCVGNEGNTIWAPVEEFQENGFVKGAMHENFRNGKFNRVPIMIGATSEEELSFDLDELRSKAQYFDSNSEYLVNGNLNIKQGNKRKAGDELKKLYTNKTFVEDFRAFVKFISDAKYTTGIYRQAELQSKFAQVLVYQFSYAGVLGASNSSIPGVGHLKDLNYLFINDFNRNITEFPEKDLKVMEMMLTLWTDFIKYIDPLRSLKTLCEWTKLTEENLCYVDITETLTARKNPRYFRGIRKIYDKYAERFQYTY